MFATKHHSFNLKKSVNFTVAITECIHGSLANSSRIPRIAQFGNQWYMRLAVAVMVNMTAAGGATNEKERGVSADFTYV